MSLRFIDKYEVISTLGRGSMGVVYKAKDPEIGRLVAIKTLKSVFMGDDASGNEALQRFRQESRSAGRLHHPNIVTIFEAGRAESGSPYIVMEYIEGKSLEAMVAEQRALDPVAALHYLAQISSAVDYAHSQNVIHRDLKPSNIIVDARHRPYLLDFGVAKLSDTSLTPAGTVVGTPSYMSPEQIRGAQLDGRTDIFSLAVVAFEVLTGTRPFPGTDFTTVVSNIIHKEPLSLDEVGSNLNRAIEPVLRKGLAKERDERFQSALELIDGLARVLGVVIDGTGIAGGYVPGMKLRDASKEASSRDRASTVLGTFYPQGVVASTPATDSSAERTVFGGSTSAAPAAESGGLPPIGAPTFSTGVSYTNGVEHSSGGSSRHRDSLSTIEEDPENIILESESSAKALRAHNRSRFRRTVIALLVVLLGLMIVPFVVPKYLPKGGFFHPAADVEPTPVVESDSPPVESRPEPTVAASKGDASIGSTPPSATAPSGGTVVSDPAVSDPVPSAPGIKPEEIIAPTYGYNDATAQKLTDGQLLYLLQHASSHGPEVLRAVIAEAGKREKTALSEVLIPVTRHADYKVRVDALKALGKPFHYAQPAVTAAIIAALKDDEFIVRGFAVKLLSRLPDPAARAALEERLLVEKNTVVLDVLKTSIGQQAGSK